MVGNPGIRNFDLEKPKLNTDKKLSDVLFHSSINPKYSVSLLSRFTSIYRSVRGAFEKVDIDSKCLQRFTDLQDFSTICK